MAAKTTPVKRLPLTMRLAMAVAVMNAAILVIWGIGLHANIATWPSEFVRLVAPNGEANFIAWYSSLLLILAAIAALANFGLDSVEKESQGSRWRVAWLGIFIVMLLLSLEEIAQIHETVGAAMRTWISSRDGQKQWIGVQGRAWILVYLPFITAVVVGFFLAFQRLFRRHRGPFAWAMTGVFLWLFSLLMEFLLSEFRSLGLWYYGLEQVLEESGEILGTSCLLIAFVWYGEVRSREVIRPPARKTRAFG